jgi:hypothetical protein
MTSTLTAKLGKTSMLTYCLITLTLVYTCVILLFLLSAPQVLISVLYKHMYPQFWYGNLVCITYNFEQPKSLYPSGFSWIQLLHERLGSVLDRHARQWCDTLYQWSLHGMIDRVLATKKANKPLIIEEFGMEGLSNKTAIYPTWVQRLLDTQHAG